MIEVNDTLKENILSAGKMKDHGTQQWDAAMSPWGLVALCSVDNNKSSGACATFPMGCGLYVSSSNTAGDAEPTRVAWFIVQPVSRAVCGGRAVGVDLTPVDT